MTKSTDSPVAISVSGVSKSFGTTSVLRDVNLQAAAGEVIALLGPSGCGKTTLLRLLAGLERPDTGEISLGGAVVAAPQQKTFVPPERRGVGLVFQDYALFPQRSVADNLNFGLRGMSKADRAMRVTEVLKRVDLAGYGQRYPHELSGGQQQRVALARALAPKPRVLLLDEPFSNLDAALRRRLRLEMGRLLKTLDVTTVFVTHDQDEALSLASRVAVMNGGQIAQVGTAQEVYGRPATAAVAQAVGEANLLAGVATDGWVETALGRFPGRGPDGAVQVLVRPEQLLLVEKRETAKRSDGTAPQADTVGAIVRACEYLGRERHVLLEVQGCPELVAVVCDIHSLENNLALNAPVLLTGCEGLTATWYRAPAE